MAKPPSPADREADWAGHRVKIRSGRGSRPRTKIRPDYRDAPAGLVTGIDRGRYSVALADGTVVQAIKARELPRGSVVVGDRVRLTGDLSGREGALARIAKVDARTGLLRRKLEEYSGERGEKGIVANADYMVIVTASADPQPRVGMVDRCLVAAREAGVTPILCMTKTDLADPRDFLDNYAGFDLLTEQVSLIGGQTAGLVGGRGADSRGLTGNGGDAPNPGLVSLAQRLRNHFSVLVGHSGVGKSTLINGLVPGAGRTVGPVNAATGKGRHTSTSFEALPLPSGGWVVDTPGVRSFGLSHVTTDDVLATFPQLAEAAEHCLPNCSHRADEPECALDRWARRDDPFTEDCAVADQADLVERARKLLK